MLKEVICKLDYSNYQEVAMVLFGLSFLAVCWGAFRLNREAAARFSSIPVDELEVAPRASASNHQDEQPQ
jgi:uncharacterized membrane protein